MTTVTHRYESTQFDGDNTNAILEFLEGAAYTVVSASAQELVLADGEGTRKHIPVSGWVVRGPSHELVWQGSADAYQAQWAQVAL